MKRFEFLRFMSAAVVAAFAASQTHAVTIPTVLVGNPGNAADTRYLAPHPNGVGSVAYPFRMGKTEVTNSQYVEFLNAVASSDPYELYNTNMGSEFYPGGGIVRDGDAGDFRYAVKAPDVGQGPGGTDYTYHDKPVVYVSWGDAVRFANWLHNGQPSGPQDVSTTEDGAYTLNGAIPSAPLSDVSRNPGARWFLPQRGRVVQGSLPPERRRDRQLLGLSHRHEQPS